jgi:hypothetical protein
MMVIVSAVPSDPFACLESKTIAGRDPHGLSVIAEVEGEPPGASCCARAHSMSTAV